METVSAVLGEKRDETRTKKICEVLHRGMGTTPQVHSSSLRFQRTAFRGETEKVVKPGATSYVNCLSMPFQGGGRGGRPE